MDLPDLTALHEMREAIDNGRLNDAPLRERGWPVASESLTTYEKWRLCDETYEMFRQSQGTNVQDKAYLKVVLCTGRALCPDITESWAHCVKHWKKQHVQQCVFVKRMVERCLRSEATEMLRKMEPKFTK